MTEHSKIYIGKRDDGTVIGVSNSKRLLEDIPNKVQSKLGIVADVNLLTENGLEYIEITVNPWAFPVNYDGEYHYRSGSTKQQLRGNALTNFLISKTGLKWDAATIADISVDDLDKESFDIFRQEALRSGRMTKEDLDISNTELLEKLDLIEDGKLKRADALCFYRKAEKVISGCYVKIGKFEGSDLLYQDEVRGSLLIIADRVIDLIYLKYLKAAISYHKETRAETLMHSHSSKPFNPDIARVFYRAGYIESWGRGIQKICDACKTLGADEPEYIVHGGDIMLKFNALQSAKVPESIATKNQDVTKNVTKNVSKETEILTLLREDASMTTTEMAQKLSVNRRTVQRELEKLKNKNCIERKGGRRYGYWEIP
ncbi:hypothetical protein IMSAGC012_00971 [Lachnospiraceae bacterium]|nr:hypothetical protein IMSAGC012_00971 [Lachnospiraceae bacterium]